MHASPTRRRLKAVLASALALVMGVSAATLVAPPAAEAAVVSPMTNAYNEVVNGNYLMVGNGVMQAGASFLSGGTPDALHNGTALTGLNNDNFTMQRRNAVPALQAAGADNSTSATLTVPAGASIAQAYLFWQGSTGIAGNGTGGTIARCNATVDQAAVPAAGSPANRQVMLQVGSGAVSSITGAITIEPTPSGTSTLPQYYSGFADVTSQLSGITTGSQQTINVGNLWAAEGRNCYAGWSLAIVYDFGRFIPGNDASAARNVIITDGHVRLGQNESQNTTFSGFTSAEGDIQASFFLGEGDRNIVGDYAEYRAGSTGSYTRIPGATGDTSNVGTGRSTGSVRYQGTGTDASFYNANVDVRTATFTAPVGTQSVQLNLGTVQDTFMLQAAALAVPVSAVRIEKTFTGSGSSAVDVQHILPGQQPSYTITVTNAGSAPVSNVRVADTLAPSCVRTIGTLAVGGTSQYTCQGPATSTGLTNTATVSGTGIADQSDTTVVNVGAISLAKTVTPFAGTAGYTGRPGDQLAYTFTLRNSGSSPLSSVTLTDSMAGLTGLTIDWSTSSDAATPAGTLSAGETVVGTARYTLTATDVDRGSVTNPNAVARGVNPNNAAVTATASATQTIPSAPALNLSKSGTLAPGATGRAGDRVNYTFSATNTGNVTLTGVTITDAHAGLTSLAYTWPGTAGVLRAGETVTATANAPITQAEIDNGRVVNTARVSGTSPTNAAVNGTASTTVAITQTPAITIDKSGSLPTGAGAAGTVVNYTFDVVNTGNVTLTGITVADPNVPTITAPSGWTGTLAPGATARFTASHTITQAEVDSGRVSNTATVRATPPTGSAITGTDTFVQPLANTPGVDLEKTGTHELNAAGNADDTILYTFRIRNTGQTTLTGVGVNDPMLQGRPIVSQTWPATQGTLLPGQLATITIRSAPIGQAAIDQGSVTNTATATATAPVTGGGTTTITDSDTHVTPVARTTSVLLTKTVTAPTGTPQVGTALPYRFVIQNTGSTTLSNVALADPMFTQSQLSYAWPGTPGTLAPGAQVVVTASTALTQAQIDSGTVGNTATATATGPSGVPSVSSTSHADAAIPRSPAITLDKTGGLAPGQVGRVGDTIRYELVLTNSGNVTLTNVSASDALPGLVGPNVVSWPGTAGTLLPGQQVRYTASYVIRASDVANGSVTNSASATGRGPVGGTPIATDAVQTPLPPATPVAVPDTIATTQGAPGRVTPLTNDAPGDPGVPLIPSTLTLMQGGLAVGDITIPNVGTFTIDRTSIAAPAVVFTPVPTFSGAVPTIDYRVNDANGTATTSTIATTVTPVTPTAQPDVATGRQGAAASVDPLANDAPGSSTVPLNRSSVTLLDGAGAPVATITVPNEGTWSVNRDDASNPRIVFTPLPSFYGTTTAVPYRVQDANGTIARSTVTAQITEVRPALQPDTGTARQGATVTVTPLSNDAPGNAEVPLVPSSITLIDAAGSVATTVTVAGQGTYELVRTGANGPTIAFTPLPSFTGQATPVVYQVSDANGAASRTTFTPTITPVNPIARADVGEGRQGALVRIDPFVNDEPGNAAVPISRPSLTLLNPAGQAVDELVIDGQGTWRVDRTDTANPTITFQPLPSFSGQATPQPYRVADANGATAQSTVGATIGRVVPVASPDVATGPQGLAARVDPLANDRPGNPDVLLVPSTFDLVDGSGTPVSQIVVAGQGTWTVDRSGSTPVVVFTPVATFTGPSTAVPYRVADANGTFASSTITASIAAVVPVANPNIGTGRQGADIRVDVLGNDLAGDPGVPLDRPTLTLVTSAGAAVESIEIPNQGTYLVDRADTANPVLVFRPLPTFTGDATTVDYRIADVNGTTATTTFRAVVTPVTPVASADTGATRQGAPTTIDVLANDRPGDAGVPLVDSTLRLIDENGAEATSVTVPGEGTWTIDASGPRPVVVFTPAPGFTGTTTPIEYVIRDANGTPVRSTITVTVTAVTPVAVNDAGSARQGATVTVLPLANDTAGDPAVPLDATTLFYLDGTDLVDTVTIPGEGVYTIDRTTDPAAPRFVFTPEPEYDGQATAVPYRVLDANGTVALRQNADGTTSQPTFTPTIVGVDPVAIPDERSGHQGEVITLLPLDNDLSGDPEVPLDPESFTLLDEDGDPVDTIEVPGEGTWTTDRTDPANPTVTFTPVGSFTGPSTPVSYLVRDANGTATNATIVVVTLTAVTPVANPDTASGLQGSSVPSFVLANDVQGHPDVPLDPTTIRLVGTDGELVAPSTPVTIDDAQGEYRLDTTDAANPRIVFVPLPGFSGEVSPVTYSIADANGTRVRTTYTPTLTPVTPIANPNARSNHQGAQVITEPLLNDAPGDPSVPLDLGSIRLVDANGDIVDDVDASVTIDGAQGVYTLDLRDPALPRIVFTPELDFVGTAEPVRYSIADENGTRARSTFTPTLTPVDPVANPDSVEGRQGATVTIDPFANDVAGDPAVPLDLPSLTLLDGDAAVDELVIDDEGTWTVDRTDPAHPVLVFEPLPGFVGSSAAPYRIVDANGTPATSTATAVITAVDPVAEPDAGEARQGATVTFTPLSNDAAGDPAVPLDPTTFTLLDGDTAVDEVTVPQVGTYRVDRTDPQNPTVVFTPVPSYAGTPAGQPYRVLDANGTAAESTLTPTITPVTPSAEPDAGEGIQGAPVTIPVLANDTPGLPEVPLVPSTLTLLDAAGNPVDVRVIEGQGTWSVVRPTDGDPVLRFEPLPGFAGESTVPYGVSDANGTRAESTATATITAVTPSASPDAATARQGAPASVDPLANDAAGDPTVPLDPETLTLLDGAGNPVAEIVIPGQGAYAIDRSNPERPLIVFTPELGFVGPADAAPYLVRDANGTPTTSRVVAVIEPVIPLANPDAESARQGSVVTFRPLGNDTQGHPDVPLVGSTFTLLDGDGQAVDTIEVPGEGVYAVDRTNPDAPVVTFTPELDLVGTATAAPYRVADANGTATTSTLTPTLVGVTPTANPDAASGRQGQRVSAAVVANDAAGDPDVPLDATTLTLRDADDAPVTEWVVDGQGRYTIDASDEDAPRIVFTPLSSFVGTATPVVYSVADVNGTLARSTFTPTLVGVTPVALDDAGAARQGATVTVSPLSNDAAGDASVPLDLESLRYVDGDDLVETVTVPGVGEYTIDREDPEAPRFVFTPEPGFFGPAPAIPYRVVDANGTVALVTNADGSTRLPTFTPTITEVDPIASPDAQSGRQGAPVSSAVLANDVAGDEDVPLVPGSLTLMQGDEAVDEVEVEDQGTYAIDADAEGGPRIVFTPLPGFVGTATPVTYRVADENGMTTSSTFTPTLIAVTPIADPDFASGRQGAPVSAAVLANDDAGHPDVPFDPSSLTLLSGGEEVDSVEVPGQGVYTIDASDEDAPRIVFTPLPGYVGTATPVDYRVLDENGTPAESTFTPTLTRVTPIASPDFASGRQGAEVSSSVLANDDPGLEDVPLDPATLTLLDAAGAPAETVTVDGQGTYRIDASDEDAPRIVFAPVPDFAGQATPVAYRVADANGTTTQSTFTPTLTAVTPAATPDAASGRQGSPVSAPVLVNDEAGDDEVPLDPETLTLLDANGDETDAVEVPGEGRYTIDAGATGGPRIVFTPTPDFVGTAEPVDYRIRDMNGTAAESTFTPTLVEVLPVASPDAGRGLQGQTVTLDALANDAAGSTDVPLVRESLTLRDGAGDPVDELVIAEVGTWTVVRDDPEHPVLRFVPEPGYVGTSTVPYTVADANGTLAPTTASATIVPVTPVAADDTSVGAAGQQQSVDPLANDRAGDPSVPLDRATLTLLDGGGAPVASVTVEGQGTYEVVDGRIVFTPVPGFVGTADGVPYRVADANGTTTQAVYTPTVVDGPVLEGQDLYGEGPRGTDVPIDPTDTVPNLDPGSVHLVDGNGDQVGVIVVPGEGTWTVDPETGVIDFEPEPGFEGDPTPIRWVGTTVDGEVVTGEVVVHYYDPVAPTAPPLVPGIDLPRTGAEIAGWLLALAAALALAGLGLLVRRRRERDAR